MPERASAAMAADAAEAAVAVDDADADVMIMSTMPMQTDGRKTDGRTDGRKTGDKYNSLAFTPSRMCHQYR